MAKHFIFYIMKLFSLVFHFWWLTQCQPARIGERRRRIKAQKEPWAEANYLSFKTQNLTLQSDWSRMAARRRFCYGHVIIWLLAHSVISTIALLHLRLYSEFLCLKVRIRKKLRGKEVLRFGAGTCCQDFVHVYYVFNPHTHGYNFIFCITCFS